ncbi:MoaD/ThiS family protein [Arthrobacter sp. JSM 101049]|uniref:MoaD/ThiS family protein n=1 Tax=Arthrobacter sp. JSM 101049 TaxID=929097 RepID=UPI0035627546
MASAVLEVPGTLAPVWGDRRRALIDYDGGASMAVFLDRAAEGHPRFARRIRDETGAVRRYVNVYVDGEDIRSAAGLDTVVPDGSTVMIIQSVAGG